jgi:hypothetical protein
MPGYEAIDPHQEITVPRLREIPYKALTSRRRKGKNDEENH